MLRAFFVLVCSTLVVAGCSSTSEPPPPETSGPYIAVYFERDGNLVPQFKELPDGDPVREVFGLLGDGPEAEVLTTHVPRDAELLQEAEPAEGELVLDLNDAFWDGSDDEVSIRVAQVLYTMGGLEEGRKVTLLDGSTPARIPGGNQGPVRQPLTTQTWPGPTPLLQIAQPPPGATVPKDIPVQVVIPKGARVWGIVSVGEVLGEKTRLRGGSGILKTDVEGQTEAKIIFVVLRGEERGSVEVPVTISG